MVNSAPHLSFSQNNQLIRATIRPAAQGKMVLQQGILDFSNGACEDPRKGMDRLETQIRQHSTTTKRNIDDDTRTRVSLRAVANVIIRC